MVTCWDKEYKDTKLIMQGKASMRPEFKPLAEWIDRTYDVKTINIIYDTIEPHDSPRLQICFELEKDKKKFDGPGLFTFDERKQKSVGIKFNEILKKEGLLEKPRVLNLFSKKQESIYKTKGIFVIFDAFEQLAKEDANESIPKTELEELIRQTQDENLWHILNAFGMVVFFLYTDDQVKQYNNGSKKEIWARMYFQLLKQYDEFDYFNEADFSISLDSKENFDKNYQSNWYYYLH